eukprot:Opistho-2@4607
MTKRPMLSMPADARCLHKGALLRMHGAQTYRVWGTAEVGREIVAWATFVGRRDSLLAQCALAEGEDARSFTPFARAHQLFADSTQPTTFLDIIHGLSDAIVRPSVLLGLSLSMMIFLCVCSLRTRCC